MEKDIKIKKKEKSSLLFNKLGYLIYIRLKKVAFCVSVHQFYAHLLENKN